MTIRSTAAALAAVLLLGTASAAMAYGPNGGCAGYGNRAAYSEYYSQLTPEKQAEVEKLVQEHTDAMAQLREQLYAKRLELDALSGNANVQPEYISKLSAEIAHLQAQIRNDGRAFRDLLSEKTGLAHIPGYEGRGCARNGMSGYHGNGEGCGRGGMGSFHNGMNHGGMGGHQGNHNMGR